MNHTDTAASSVFSDYIWQFFLTHLL